MSNLSHVAAYGGSRVGVVVPMVAPPSSGGGIKEWILKTAEQLKREYFSELAPLLWNSFGTIASLLQVDDADVIGFLLETEIIPLCLRTMELGSELSKTV
ncbi:hypothetical protein Leryth_007825 [Lithospermum erythrorhizon]|nr:hypothetical protein Leryth_007825 [Lithospermum erythrorhizon]